MIDPAVPLACPLDGLALTRWQGSWRCAGNHNYDVAREGYLNLLPVRYKPSKDPGDSRSMIGARRRVLDAGLFEPLADVIADVMTEALTETLAETSDETLAEWSTGTQLAETSTGTSAGTLADTLSGSGPAAPGDESLVLDAGCGEGYYTERLHRTLLAHENFENTRILGIDISRWAIAAAAKRHRTLSWVVANNRCLPILPGRCNLITSIFGFETWQPWGALQHSGQRVLVAHAGPLHLIELRKAIYATVRVHAPPTDVAALEAGYERIGESTLTTSRTVVAADLWTDILAMTPHGHRASTGDANLCDTLADTSLTLDVQLRWYRRS